MTCHEERAPCPSTPTRGCSCSTAPRSPSSWDDTVKHVHDILTKHQSEIVASRQWDERRLAYPVDGHKKGTYLLTYFKTDGANLKEIVADCHLSDVILRELILKVHPKLVDHLVTQAMTSTPNVEAEEAHLGSMSTRSAPAAAAATTDARIRRRGSSRAAAIRSEPASTVPISLAACGI